MGSLLVRGVVPLLRDSSDRQSRSCKGCRGGVSGSVASGTPEANQVHTNAVRCPRTRLLASWEVFGHVHFFFGIPSVLPVKHLQRLGCLHVGFQVFKKIVWEASFEFMTFRPERRCRRCRYNNLWRGQVGAAVDRACLGYLFLSESNGAMGHRQLALREQL